MHSAKRIRNTFGVAAKAIQRMWMVHIVPLGIIEPPAPTFARERQEGAPSGLKTRIVRKQGFGAALCATLVPCTRCCDGMRNRGVRSKQHPGRGLEEILIRHPAVRPCRTNSFGARSPAPGSIVENALGHKVRQGAPGQRQTLEITPRWRSLRWTVQPRLLEAQKTLPSGIEGLIAKGECPSWPKCLSRNT